MARMNKSVQQPRGKSVAASQNNGSLLAQTESPMENMALNIEENIAAVEDNAAAVIATQIPSVEWPLADVNTPITVETISDTAATVAPAPLQKGTDIMNEAIETGKAYVEDAKTRIQGAVTEMNEKTKAAVEKSTKAMEEFGEMAKGNLEAMVESSKIAAKGVEAMGQDAAEYGRKSFEKTSATFKSFAAIKSPAEFFQLQSELMTSTFDAMAAEAAKSSEAMLKLAGDIAQPISSRVAVVSDKIKTIAA